MERSLNSSIENIHAREILDSRGNPTIEVDVYLCNGIMGEQRSHQEHQLVISKLLNFEIMTHVVI